jgi:4-hydroxy-3-methylbut-2-enyl diphosphate reductase
MTGRIKESRRVKDLRKQDFLPTLLDFGPVQFVLARHFGFCYGVENAIEISYRALEENPDKKVYLLSQMIHNQEVNNDLESRGIKFIMDTDGSQFIPWDKINHDDVVIIPAFGTTLEIENLLLDKGVEVQKYNTTCPFVEKVWNRAEKLGQENYTIIIHGKPKHEETKATFSHSNQHGPSIWMKLSCSQTICWAAKPARNFTKSLPVNFHLDSILICTCSAWGLLIKPLC